jgi:mRNA-binding protein PUF3
MTDVFGNYVIQKLFEHGSQTQKKVLANQMKNRVMHLSTQMYGCRVVQKALEHILTDQQASMVKELEAHVLKCVKDQNGNHVIQKAIERVPAEHIQFIINAFTGQVNRLAAHPYGCRVIQRMLEHCEEPARQSILHELHAGVYQLITDQYGNYVIQHVIEKGHEYDRTKVVATVISQLLIFSKHKFASNVVEKSIQCAEASQRAEILRILTTPNDKGESPLLGLMRDQYGNYVIRELTVIRSFIAGDTDKGTEKSLGDFGFKSEEREHLVEHCKPEFMKLKRFSSGKQVMALEKLMFDGDSEPNLSSSQSSTIPSTNTSTVEGPTTLTLPPVQILKTSLVAEPATAIASTP